MAIKSIITWDLGATKCAAALMEYNTFTGQINYLKHHTSKLIEQKSLSDLIAYFEFQLDINMDKADAICIGAAGVYDGEQLILESGYPFVMKFSEAARKFNWQRYAIVHDYTPILCATFTEYVKNLENIKYLNQTEVNWLGRRIALGIGTGLGAKDGVLFPNGDFWLGTNEIGHIGIIAPPFIESEDLKQHLEFMKFLNSEGVLKADEPITFEKILSGQGMVRIHQFISNDSHSKTPEEIGILLRAGQAHQTQAFFAWYLGLFVGTVELSFMPDGGIWITGGVAMKHLEVFSEPNFYKGIAASPSYLKQRQSFSLAVMHNERHAFYGGAYYAAKRLL